MRIGGRREKSSRAQIQTAGVGVGPLLRRDYWAVINHSSLRAPGVARLVAEKFADFAPPEYVHFYPETDGGLQCGDELELAIRMAGTARVRVVHRDSNSITLATLAGHPEAGRITFGAYPNTHDDVIFHICSRARARSRIRYLGFLLLGDPMQTNTWIGFIERVAVTAGKGVIGAISVEKCTVEDDASDRSCDAPTFLAQGD